MAFTPKDWRNATTATGGGDTSTPLNAAALEDLETRLSAYTDLLHTQGAYDVKLYGAVGDGSTTDTTAVDAAITAASAAGGGIVWFPEGTYMCNVTARPKVRLVGAGAGVSILKSVAGANTDVVKGLNFATLTDKAYAAGDYALGAYEFSMQDLTVDGNKATNSSGWGVRLWGRCPRFYGTVEVRDCKSGGIWNEFTEVDSFADPLQVLEGYAENVVIHDIDGDGWIHRGPHDFVVQVCEIWECTGYAVKVQSDDSPDGLQGLSWNGGVSFRHLNFFLCANGAYHDGGDFQMHGGAITGDSGVGVGVETTARTGGMKIADVVVAGHHTGFILRGSEHAIRAECLRLTTQAITLDGVSNSMIDVYGSSNETVFNIITDGGNIVRGMFDVAVGKSLKSGGAWSSGSSVMLRSGGGVNSYVQQFPSATLTAAGWSPVLPASNGTLLATGSTVLTYSASIATDASLGQLFYINVTNGTAFTISAPTNATAKTITYFIVNSSGGAMGAITWNGVFHLAGAFTNPANGKMRSITFGYVAGADWMEVSRAAADIT